MLFIYAVSMAFIDPTGTGFAHDFGLNLGTAVRFIVTLGGLI